MDLKEEDILGPAIEGHWYYVSKGRALASFVKGLRPSALLDVGAGSGVFSRYFLDKGLGGGAVCVDPFYAEEREETHNGKPISFVRETAVVSQDLILMIDVLEHVDDDIGLLRTYTNLMPPDGHVLIGVPAFPFLWSGHDVFLEHRRRYILKTLAPVIDAAGLEIVRARYFFGGLFPAMALYRLVSRLLQKSRAVDPHSDLALYPAWLNRALILFHDLELLTLLRVNRLAGLSLLCLCRRKERT